MIVVQVVEQSRKEKVAMYMKVPKVKLVEMLINCNDILQGAPQIYMESLPTYTQKKSPPLCDAYIDGAGQQRCNAGFKHVKT